MANVQDQKQNGSNGKPTDDQNRITRLKDEIRALEQKLSVAELEHMNKILLDPAKTAIVRAQLELYDQLYDQMKKAIDVGPPYACEGTHPRNVEAAATVKAVETVKTDETSAVYGTLAKIDYLPWFNYHSSLAEFGMDNRFPGFDFKAVATYVFFPSFTFSFDH